MGGQVRLLRRSGERGKAMDRFFRHIVHVMDSKAQNEAIKRESPKSFPSASAEGHIRLLSPREWERLSTGPFLQKKDDENSFKARSRPYREPSRIWFSW